MSNEIGFNSEKVNFFTMPLTSHSARNLDLYQMVSKDIDINCVKCGKPLTLEFNEKLMRCPFCSDFFKPHAQLIFQIEEKIQGLTTEQPVTFFLINKRTKLIILILLLLGFLNYENLISLSFFMLIIGLIGYELYASGSKKVRKFKYLNERLKELESDYQKIKQ